MVTEKDDIWVDIRESWPSGLNSPSVGELLDFLEHILRTSKTSYKKHVLFEVRSLFPHIHWKAYLYCLAVNRDSIHLFLDELQSSIDMWVKHLAQIINGDQDFPILNLSGWVVIDIQLPRKSQPDPLRSSPSERRLECLEFTHNLAAGHELFFLNAVVVSDSKLLFQPVFETAIYEGRTTLVAFERLEDLHNGKIEVCNSGTCSYGCFLYLKVW